MKTIRQLVATTRVDRHGDRFTREALEGAARGFSEQYVPVLLDHDQRCPPIGRSIRGEVEQLDDGAWGLFVTSEYFEPDTEPELGDREIALRPLPADTFTLIVDRSYRDSEDQQVLGHLREMGVLVENMEKKALEPLSAIILGVVAAASAGFFGKLGSDAWDAVKAKIAVLLKKKRAEQKQHLVILEVDYQRSSAPLKVRVILESPEPEVLDALWSHGLLQLEADLRAWGESVPPHVRLLVYSFSGGVLEPRFAVRKDCVPIGFSRERGHDG